MKSVLLSRPVSSGRVNGVSEGHSYTHACTHAGKHAGTRPDQGKGLEFPPLIDIIEPDAASWLVGIWEEPP